MVYKKITSNKKTTLLSLKNTHKTPRNICTFNNETKVTLILKVAFKNIFESLKT